MDKTEREIAVAREKLARHEKLSYREWMLIQYDSQGCHCGSSAGAISISGEGDMNECDIG